MNNKVSDERLDELIELNEEMTDQKQSYVALGASELLLVFKELKELRNSLFRLNLGNGFYLSKGMAPDRIWIERECGEGGDFDIKDMIKNFYEDKF